jgi:hypothetical protein
MFSVRSYRLSRPINEPVWQQLTEQLTSEMREWRLVHPNATLREIETELDARLSRMRARMLEDLALTSSAAVWTDTPALQHPRCSQCDTPLDDAGAKTRTLQTHGGQQLALRRSYGICPACGAGLFPPR